MQANFERNLVLNYLPYLIPGVKSIAFAKEELQFYFNNKFKVYPSALIFRDSADIDYIKKFDFDDNNVPGGKMTSGSYFPYRQSYSVKVFVEKQSEMLTLRDAMRIRYQKDPYNKLVGYSSDYPEMSIGLWLTKLSTEDVRTSSDEKGAQRIITFDFEANLVMTSVQEVEEIEDINFNGI